MNSTIRFIDLFAGMGGLRIGFENAFNKLGYETECVFTSEIKPHAIKTLKENFENEKVYGDITKIKSNNIPDFNFLLAGFPCQAFSQAGNKLGFNDTRGTLFFEVERILKEKKPEGFVLENVEGLITHDKVNKDDKIGRTLTIILESLNNLGYNVTWKLLNSSSFGVPQSRNRIFIVGLKNNHVNLDNFTSKKSSLKEILEVNKPTVNSKFTRTLLKHYKPEELYGKAIKDKRGGSNNIHSWDFCLKGEITEDQKELLNLLFKERRKKHWSKEIGIKWMDGIPLTVDQISTFYDHPDLENLLIDLTKKGYLVKEYPKDLMSVHKNDKIIKRRMYDKSKEKGYNIVTGKLSFEFSKILDPNSIAPTLVATDISRIGVIDNGGIRNLTIREGLRLFGFDETYNLPMFKDNKRDLQNAFDLLGNTVVIPVVSAVCQKIGEVYLKNNVEIEYPKKESITLE